MKVHWDIGFGRTPAITHA